jgi:hypothetical protein
VSSYINRTLQAHVEAIAKISETGAGARLRNGGKEKRKWVAFITFELTLNRDRAPGQAIVSVDTFLE